MRRDPADPVVVDIAEARRHLRVGHDQLVRLLRPERPARVVGRVLPASALLVGLRVVLPVTPGGPGQVWCCCADPLTGRIRVALEDGRLLSLAPDTRVMILPRSRGDD